ncbi:MFS transporter [Galactobacter valiniphilus]|uniref:MFS transporter n=1 Tax=Galactobacter valiniphilus TaxID=2676122 RepID=UPI001F190DC0|nr:MFS transporter [Galactobacter valiniphilus]
MIRSQAPSPRAGHAVPYSVVSAVVGALVLVELTSGVLQGYYTPLLTDIARALGITDADVTWLEAVQLAVSALTVPLLAAAGDRVGHRRVLIISSVVTAAASWALLATGAPVLFFAAWALQGLYAVWLPAEIALIHTRARAHGAPGAVTRRAAGLLVGALELGVIVGALAGGQLITVTGNLSLTLAIPAIVTTLCVGVIAVWVKDPAPAGAAVGGPGSAPESPAERERRRGDILGASLLALTIAALMGALSLLRVQGLGWPVLAFVAVALVLGYLFARQELGHASPTLDLRVLSTKRQGPVQLTAFLFGASILGAQAPLSTFARTDPAVSGHGLGLSSGQASYVIGAYVLSLALGALALGPLTKRLALRDALIAGALLTALGYALFLPNHASLAGVIANMAVAGLGSGLLVAALPPAAAAAAPPERTGMATGATNAIKTLGGAFASAVFGLALAHGGAGADGSAPLSGYLTVWGICAGTSLLAAALLLRVPRASLQDA